MLDYRISNEAQEDIIRLYEFGNERFGEYQAEKYIDGCFNFFNLIAERPLAFESINYIRNGYRRGFYGSNTIYFRINDESIEIMAILGRQDLNKAL